MHQRHGDNWKEVVTRTGAMMLSLGNGQAMTLESIKSILCPVLVAVGDKDKMVTVEESQEISNQLQHGKLKILENVKHPLEVVDTQLLKEMIINFIPTIPTV